MQDIRPKPKRDTQPSLGKMRVMPIANHRHPYFRGIRLQRGSGIGSIFSSLFRSALPLFKSVGRSAAKYGKARLLDTGSAILDDLIDGESLKTSLKNNFNKTKKRIASDMLGNIKKKMRGGGHVNKKKQREKTRKTNLRKTEKLKQSRKKKKNIKKKRNSKPKLNEFIM